MNTVTAIQTLLYKEWQK